MAQFNKWTLFEIKLSYIKTLELNFWGLKSSTINAYESPISIGIARENARIFYLW